MFNGGSVRATPPESICGGRHLPPVVLGGLGWASGGCIPSGVGQVPGKPVQFSTTRGCHDFNLPHNLPDQSCPLAEFQARTLQNSRAKTRIQSVSYVARP